jgi:hypothetical protein
MTGPALGCLAALGALEFLATLRLRTLDANQVRQSAAVLTIVYGAIAAPAIALGLYPLAAPMVGASVTAFWVWWRNGGGKDTKRHLRALADRFRPVRRTAPAAAS